MTQQRIKLIRTYLERLHGGVTEEMETSISGRAFTVCPGVFSPENTFASEFLSNHLLVRPGDSVLDIGTGIGVQAVFAGLKQAGRVIATDINPQAAACTDINIKKFGLDAIVSTRQGDLFETVPNDRFDLIIWNAPYLPDESRSVAEMSWNSGRRHSVVSRFLAEVRDYLTERGRVQILFSSIGDLNWFIEKAEDCGFNVDILASLTAGWEHLVIFILVPSTLEVSDS